MTETGERRQPSALQRAVGWEIRAHAVLVTGAGSGIGQAVAVGLGDVGVPVAVADIDEGRIAETTSRLEETSTRCVGVRGDVGSEPDVTRLVQEAGDALGPIDAVVHCAGIYPRSAVVEMAPDEWDRVLRTNLTSLFLLARTCLPQMTQRGIGRFIAFSSDIGGLGMPRGSHYAASKAGVTAFTRSVAREVAGTGVTVNAVAPGPTDTAMLRGSNTPEYIQRAAGATVQGTIGKPQDVVGTVLFLLSDGGSEISGQLISLRS